MESFEQRKRDHLLLAQDARNQASGQSGLDSIHLNHDALPQIDFEEIDLQAPFLGHALQTPFGVAGMTAGHADAASWNERLAAACEERGWIFGVGSQRRELEGATADLRGVDRWAEFRARHGNLVVLGNLGASQVAGASVENVERMLGELRPNALAIHLNPLQEALQPEGTPRFRNVVESLRALSKRLSVPIVIKETGCGFSDRALIKLADLALAAIDVSGRGGTHWGRIEGRRAPETSLAARAAETFADWGETTVDSVLSARRVFAERRSGAPEIWASGGVRNGLEAAKLIALGATRVSYAQPALLAAQAGDRALRDWMSLQEYELKIALFCSGARTPAELRARSDAWRRA